MIKAKARTASGKPFLLFGLEAGNVDELKKGRPIRIDGSELGIPFDVCIMYGETKEAMIEELKKAGFALPPESEWKKP